MAGAASLSKSNSFAALRLYREVNCSDAVDVRVSGQAQNQRGILHARGHSVEPRM